MVRQKDLDEYFRGKKKCPVEKNLNKPVGVMFVKKILEAKQYCVEKDQNFTLFCAGVTGGGKSTLMLHSDVVLGEVDYDTMAFSIDTMGRTYKKVKEKQEALYEAFLDKLLSLGYPKDKATSTAKELSAGIKWDIDELKAYSTKHASSFNTDLLDLFMSFRFKNYFTWANAPSVRIIDRKFLEEKVFDAFIYIYSAQARYWWFTYDQFMQMNRVCGGYDAPIIQKYGAYFAEFDGYFNAVSDSVFSDYEEHKYSAVKGVEDKFIDKYGEGEVYSLTKISDVLDVSYPTAKKYIEEMLEKGLLPQECKKKTGQYSISEQFIPEIEEYLVRFSQTGVKA